MKRLTLLVLPCIVGLVVATLAFFPLHTRTASAAASGCGSWKVVPSIRTNYNQLYGVAAISSNDVWAVGDHEELRNSITLAEHWNGSSWSVVPTPKIAKGSSVFYSVAAISTNDVWAVGISNTNKGIAALTEHWNGTAWSIISAPGKGPLNAVTAISTNDVWATGYTGGKATWVTLIEHWNGTAWSIVKSPSVKGVNNFLNGVTAIESNDIWAAGFAWTTNGTTYTSATLTEHWNGSTWSIVKSPNPVSLQGEFYGITAISSHDIWAVGSAFPSNGSTKQSLTEHWNGSKWSIVNSPSPFALYNTLLSVTAIATNDVWAVGAGSSVSGGGTQIIIEQWNGSQWNVVKSPNPSSSSDGLAGITIVPQTHTMWAVGTYSASTGDHSLTEFYCS